MSLLLSSYPTLQKLWGLLEYKPQWTLTLRGWCLIILLMGFIFCLLVISIQPFLGLTRPIDADILVVEGWVGDEVIKGAIAEFKRKNYQLMLTTGTPIRKGKHFSRYKSQAEIAAATAITLGLDPHKVIPVTSPIVKVNRTAASAIAVKDWLSSSNLKFKRLNVYSYDVHTRRSWLIFKRVLAPGIRVGAIAYPSPHYEAKKWWTASEGVRSVLSEAIAYLYARFVWRYD